MKPQGIARLLVLAFASLVPLVRTHLVVACAIVALVCFVVGRRQVSVRTGPGEPLWAKALGLAVIICLAWVVAVTLPTLIPQVSRSVIQSAIALLAASEVGFVLAKLAAPSISDIEPADLIITSWGVNDESGKSRSWHVDAELSKIMLLGS